MTRDADKVLHDIRAVMAELQALAKDTAEMTGERTEAAKESLRERLDQAAETVRGLERDLRQRAYDGAQAANDYVKDNPWRSVGIAAALAFLLGTLVSRRD